MPGDPSSQSGGKIHICHWSNNGQWHGLNVSNEALEGHEEHQWDIWPPVPGVTDGQNVGRGEAVYMNGCKTVNPDQTLPTPEPSVSPSVSPSLSLSPTPEPTVTVTATATSTPPIPTPCPTDINEAVLLVPLLAVMLGSATWQYFRRR